MCSLDLVVLLECASNPKTRTTRVSTTWSFSGGIINGIWLDLARFEKFVGDGEL